MENGKWDVVKNTLATWGKMFGDWVYSLSERSLNLSAIAIFHAVFIPNMLAYLNGITDELPSIDTYLLVVVGLVVLNVRAIIKKDQLASFLHMVGFVAQLVIIAWVLLK